MLRLRPSRFHDTAVNDEEAYISGDDTASFKAPTFGVELSDPGSLNTEKDLIQEYRE